jgi:hypothetical protein
LLVIALVVLAALGLFWLVVPMALKASPVALAGPVKQTIARTSLYGFGFGLLYLWGAWLAIRQVKNPLKGS